MVGCFPKTFRKTYVISQKPPIPQKHKPTYSPFPVDSSPSTSIVIDHPAHLIEREPVIGRKQPSPIIKVIDTSDNEFLQPKKSKGGLQDKNKGINETKETVKANITHESLPSTESNKSKSVLKTEESEVEKKTVKYLNGTLPTSEETRNTTKDRALPKLPSQPSENGIKQSEKSDNGLLQSEKSKESLQDSNSTDQLYNKNKNNGVKETKETFEANVGHESLPSTESRKLKSALKTEQSEVEEKTVKYVNGTLSTSEETTNTTIERALPKLPSESSENDIKQSEKNPVSEMKTMKQTKRKAPTIEESSAKTNIQIAEREKLSPEESIYVLPEGPKLNSKHQISDTADGEKESIYGSISDRPSRSTITSSGSTYGTLAIRGRRSGIQPIRYDPIDNVQLPVYLKSEDEENLIKRAIEKNDFLNKVIKKQVIMDAIINAMYDKDIRAKETIIKQGDKGSHMYISAKGRYQIIIKGKPVGEFSDVRVFGELAILYQAPRKATIKALTAGKVWVLDQQYYHQITVGHYIQNQDEIMNFLRNNEKLKVAGQPVLQVVANLLKTEFFPAGQQIVKQGDPGHQFFIIRAGTVTITKEGQGVVGVSKKGDCFGELALLKEDKRQATVTADSPGVECLTLTREQFIQHFGEVDSFKDAKRYDKRDSVQVVKAEYEDIKFSDLAIVTTLGVGGFGRVELVQNQKDKSMVFALKYLKKYDIVSQHQQEHVVNERIIQMACRSPFIVRMYRTFRDNKFVFFLMEPCLGGDVWGLLQKQKNRRFEEREARFISASVVEAFEYLHARGIIYRDLKPENLLIAENGYIKLTDFGFAKKMTERGKTFTFAGTPEYVAPEIVLNRGHDRAVDYWTLGIFVYEMLRGKTPFRTDDSSHMKTYTKILGGIDNVDFGTIPQKARHLIEKLCRPIPADRLGMQKKGIVDIKEHRWFLGFDWKKFSKCEISSPFIPKLKSPTDTSYIDKFKKDGDVPPDEMSGWDASF